MAKGYLLSEADLKILQGMLDREKQRVGNPQQRPFYPDDDPQAPEVYIALTPGGGIPARSTDLAVGTGTGSGTGVGSGNTPGKADCQVYQVVLTNGVADLLQAAPVVRSVYNLSTTKVPGNSWVLVARDKYGSWVAVLLSAGGGAASTISLTMPSIFVVAGSPVTGSGAFTISLATETAAKFWAGPITGGADSSPTFRSIVDTDLPVASKTQAGIVNLTSGQFLGSGDKCIDGTIWVKQSFALKCTSDGSPTGTLRGYVIFGPAGTGGIAAHGTFLQLTAEGSSGANAFLNADDGTAGAEFYLPSASLIRQPRFAIDTGAGSKQIGQTHTMTVAKLTAGGSNGSLTFTGGILTAFTDPT